MQPVEAAQPVHVRPRRAKLFALFAAFAVFAYGLDQLSKFLGVTNLTEGEDRPVLPPVLQW